MPARVPIRILARCNLCVMDGTSYPFEAGLSPEGKADFDRHLKDAHGLVFDPPTLEEWLGRRPAESHDPPPPGKNDHEQDRWQSQALRNMTGCGSDDDPQSR